MDPEFCDDLLQSHSDAELISHILSSPQCTSAIRVARLSSNLISKQYETSEVEDAAKAMDIANNLGIRSPRLRRIVINEPNAYFIMDWIHGTTLDVVWTKLSWLATIKLGLQLRGFVKTLRSLTSPTAGSLITGQCNSFWLEDRFGLPDRSGSSEITQFFRFWINFTSMRRAVQGTDQSQVVVSSSAPLSAERFVLTHHDLAPRNLILSPSGQLWLLDWDYAGFYPVYFEYAAMYNFHMPEDWGLLARLRWYLFTWLAVGSYEVEARLLRSIRSKSTRFSAGRRFELLRNGGPSRYPVS